MLKQLSRQNAVRKKRKDRGQTLGLFLMALPMMIVVTIFSYIPMGGLIVATALTVFVLPVTYALFHNIGKR